MYGDLQTFLFPKNPRLLWKWMGGSRSEFCVCGKSSQCSSKQAPIFWSSQWRIQRGGLRGLQPPLNFKKRAVTSMAVVMDLVVTSC